MRISGVPLQGSATQLSMNSHQILPVIPFEWKMVPEKWGLGSGSLETVGSGILIQEQLQLTLVINHGELWLPTRLPRLV